MSAPTTPTGPFLDLGFTKVVLEPKNDNLEFDISGRQVDQVNQWLHGEIDPVGRGVIIGTIELVPRETHPYAGREQVGTGKHQIPESVAREEWNKAVTKGRERWMGVVGATPKDTTAPSTLAKAGRQNELIYALVLLANQAMDPGIGQQNGLRYVGHQHVASVDEGLMMAYGRATHAWEDKDVTYLMSDGPTEPMLALLGNSNASFVQFLIEQFGHRLGISRLLSITVCRMGLDIHWNFG